MKKSKILSLSLATASLVGVSIAIPLVATSCSTQKIEFSYIGENVINTLPTRPGTNNEQISIPYGSKITREEGTNNFTFEIAKNDWQIDDLGFINLNKIFTSSVKEINNLFQLVPKQKLINLNFDKNLLDANNVEEDGPTVYDHFIATTIGIKDVDGKVKTFPYDTIDYEGLKQKIDWTKPYKIFDTLRVIQYNADKWDSNPDVSAEQNLKNCLEKEVIFDFSLTIKPVGIKNPE